MYITYGIHVETNNLTLLNRYASEKEAWVNLKKDLQQFMKEYKNCDDVRAIQKIEELSLPTTSDGYYYKVSNKYSNRISVFERETQVLKGTFYNSNDMSHREVFVFSIMSVEVPTYTRGEMEPIATVKRTLNTHEGVNKNMYHVQFMEELKIYLERRRVAIEGIKEKND